MMDAHHVVANSTVKNRGKVTTSAKVVPATKVVHDSKTKTTRLVSGVRHVPLGPVQSPWYGGGALLPKTKTFNYKQMLAENLGDTPEGRTWAHTAVHPCGEGEFVGTSLGGLMGMPDTMTGSVATPVYRNEYNIVFDGTLFSSTIDNPSGTWGIDAIVAPVPEIDFVYRLHYDPTGVVSEWVAVRTPNLGITPGVLGTNNPSGKTFATMGYGKVRHIALGHTFMLDATANTDQGRVVVGQMQGQWDHVSVSAVQAAYNVGDGNGLVTWKDQVLPVIGFSNTTKLHMLSIPTDPGVITSACPLAYQGEARDGAYLVTKFSSPLLGYQFKTTGRDSIYDVSWSTQKIGSTGDWTAPPGDNGVSTNAQNLPSSGFMLVGSSGIDAATNGEFFAGNSATYSAGTVVLPLKRTQNASPSEVDVLVNARQIHPFVSEPSDMMTGVVTFRGLLVGPGIGGTVSVRVKSRQYFETITSGSDPSTTPFVHAPADLDMSAVQNVVIMGKQMADAYPASYNENGDILDEAFHALTGVVSPLARTVAKAGIPVVSDIAKLL
jgi:hypothetical protein